MHPAVTTGPVRPLGQRAADRMKAMLATWAALMVMGLFIAGWMVFNSHLISAHHFDPYPWILLNLCLSTLAGLQCFVLLIANKRGEQVAAELALHDYQVNRAAIRAVKRIAEHQGCDISEELSEVEHLLQ
jgi:uncharacterized membrane protein